MGPPRDQDEDQDQTLDPSPSRLHDLKAAAELTSLSVSSLRRAIRLRRLAYHKIGSAIRISEADLHAFLARCRRKAR